MSTSFVAALIAALALGSLSGALSQESAAPSAENSGYATYSNNAGGVCPKASSALPGVAMNAAQFGNGDACGQCVQIQGTGNGAGSNPVSTAPYIAVVTNVCPQCAPGDIDLQEAGSGKFGITWSFVACPGAGRKLIEQPQGEVMEIVRPVEEAAAPVVEAAAPAVVLPDQLSTAEASISSAVEPAEETPEEVASPAAAPVAAEESSESAAVPAVAPVEEQQPTSRKLLRGLR